MPSMKILIQSLNFHPDLTGIGKYSAEMAVWLASKGHRVRVISAPPYYPNWTLNKAYKRFFWSLQEWSGVQIWRCPICVVGKPTTLNRVIQYVSFALSAFPILIYQAFWRPNILISVEPPLISAPSVAFIGRLIGAKTILHIQDYEIDAAFNFGLLSGGFLKKIAFSIEKMILLSFDRVSTISKGMIKRALDKGVTKSNIIFFPNWIDVDPFLDSKLALTNKNGFKAVNYRDLLQIPASSMIALYSGTMGIKQDLHVLVEVAKLFIVEPLFGKSVYFIFCGDGPCRKDLESLCFGLDNVYFLNLQAAENLPALLMTADIHLMPQRNDVGDLMMPSKLSGMLASGRPVIASAIEGTEVGSIIKKFGIVVPPGDPKAFYDAILELAFDEDLRDSLGTQGQIYAIKNLSRENILKKFEQNLLDLL